MVGAVSSLVFAYEQFSAVKSCSNGVSIFFLSFLWFQIVQKTFITTNGDGKMVPNQVAGEILSFFTRNNFVVLDRGETIT